MEDPTLSSDEREYWERCNEADEKTVETMEQALRVLMECLELEREIEGLCRIVREKQWRNQESRKP